MTPITDVLVRASSYDLTDLAAVKLELNIPTAATTRDAWLSTAISQVSEAAASYCHRVFPRETVQDSFVHNDPWFHASHGFRISHNHGISPEGALLLSRRPVLNDAFSLSASAEVDSGNVLTFADTSAVKIGQPVAHLSVPDGTVVTAVASGTVTLSASLLAPVLAGDVVGFGLTVSRFTSTPSSRVILPATDYLLDAAAGRLLWHQPLGWHTAVTTVSFRGGYVAPFPSDLVLAVLRGITGRFAARGRDPLLKEQNQPMAGNQSYWVGTTPGSRGGFTSEIADLLDQFMDYR
jgi:hypothetical protein